MTKKLKTFLKKIKSDYDHPWPDEDKLTKKHRLRILKEVKLLLLK